MSEIVLSFVLDQLYSLLREKGRLLGGLGQEVQLITNELGHMKAFLRVAEAKEEDEPRLKEWIKQVQEAAYDAEDVLDEFVSLFAPGQRCSKRFYGSIKRIFNSIKNLRAHHRIALELQDIKARIEHISEAHQRYQSEYGIFEGSVSESTTVTNKNAWRYNRDDALLVDEARLVGIKQPKQQLISQLLQDDFQLKVVSVVGMGGLGKTTLVKRVHEDVDVRRNFPIRAWVTVSQTFDFRELLKSLIRELHEKIQKPVPQSIESMTDLQLKEFVKSFLQQARYVIVFDDVWDMEFWNAIKFVLPENNSSSGNRVMLTTRIMDIASSASCKGFRKDGYVHKMEPLSNEESWNLFCDRTFQDGCCPEHLKNIAKVILDKCKGLPLAILAICGILASKDVSRIDEWERVRLSLRGELEGSGQLNRINKILGLSYDDLPSNLKTCLLYLSIYPEDCENLCRTLVHFWIGERFVEEREGMNIEDVSWEYLRQLASRSLIQVTSMHCEGMPETCRIHDLLREFVHSKSNEKNLVSVVTSGIAGNVEHKRWSEKVRRLVAYKNFLTNYQESSSRDYYCFSHLRSLILSKVTLQESKTLLSQLLYSCKLLKLLDLSETDLEEIPNEIFSLFHLKFLNLRDTRVKKVPKSIGKLQNLEYLNVAKTEVRELPNEITKLKKLRFLVAYEKANFGGCRVPSKTLEGLLALQTLSIIDATPSTEENGTIIKEIGNLIQLRWLEINNLKREDGKELLSSLENLINLKQLDVSSIGKDEVLDLNHDFHPPPLLQYLVLRGRLEKLPQFITCLQGLTTIFLQWSGVRENDFLGSLQYLPNLMVVYLLQAYQGEGLCIKAGGFLNLKELYVLFSEELRWMTIEEGAMPHLRLLNLTILSSLNSLPVGIQHLTHLQTLVLGGLNPQLIEELNSEQSEEYQKIAYIPQVDIIDLTSNERRTRHLWGRKKT